MHIAFLTIVKNCQNDDSLIPGLFSGGLVWEFYYNMYLINSFPSLLLLINYM